MDNLPRHVVASTRAAAGLSVPSIDPTADAPPLLDVLWRRRWAVIGSVIVCLGAAVAYLHWATPIFRATARVSIEPNAPRPLETAQGGPAASASEGFLQTEADAIQSGPVLARALDAVGYRDMRTFADVHGDAVAWLKNNGPLKVEVSRKSDVVSISMESRYAAEAAQLANAIVAAYAAQVTHDKNANGQELLHALQGQRDTLQARLEGRLQRMSDLKRQKQVLSFKDDRSNPVLERAATLFKSYTDAEVVAIDLRSQRDALKAALTDPSALTTLVESQQLRVKESGDHEYDDLRSQLTQTDVSMAAAQEVLGPNHPRIVMMQGMINALHQRIAEKERSMVAAQLLTVNTQLAAAEQKSKDLRTAMESQRDQALDLSPAALEYGTAEAEVQQIQKQLDLIDGRMAEVNVNTLVSRPLNVRPIDPARVEEKPVRPSRTLVLAAALMAGLMLGVGLAVVREQRDARLHNPAEILARLRVPVIATVPRINPRLSPGIRGQIVRLDAHSLAAEAYRSVRTSLHLGVASEARSILVASPGQGDGKSTTASNLAIAFAHSGERTLLIDCDLREPVQHLIFEVDGKTGLTSAIAGETKLPDAIRPTRVPGLHVLPCGPLPTQPSELLAGKRFKRMMQVLSKTFDRIIIDAPPLMRFTDGTILAASADVTLLVLRLNQSMRPLSEAALERLGQVGARVLGAVANGGTADVSPYYGRSWNYSPSQGGQLVGTDWTSSDRQVTSRPTPPAAEAEAEAGEEDEVNADFDVDQLVALHVRAGEPNGDPQVALADTQWMRKSAG